MATKHWDGKAPAVAQDSRVTMTLFSASTTYDITIGGVKIEQIGTTDISTTLDNLVTKLNASTHPYFAAITWSKEGTDTLKGVADTAGVPFTFTANVTGGTGTWGAVSDTTANKSPNDVNDGDNWDGGVKPAAADDIIVKNSGVSMLWGLDQSAIDLTSLTVEKSFTGKIGLNSSEFATSATGVDTSVPEYRDSYLKIGATDIDIGNHSGPGTPAGSTRIKIDNDKVGASDCRVHDSASSGEGNLPAFRYKAANASANIDVSKAPGGVGIATEVPGETSTLGTVDVTATDRDTGVYVGDGVTLTNLVQREGRNVLSAAATVTLVQVDGGELDIVLGDFQITTLTLNGGTVRDRHSNGVSPIIGTLNMKNEDAEIDFSGSGEARTVTTLNFDDGTLTADFADMTFTTLNKPSGLRDWAVSS